jgi:hypothetical protein
MPRNTHPLNDLLHLGTEPASAIVLSDDIGPYSSGTTVQDLLDEWASIINAHRVPTNAVIKKTIANVAAWTWIRRMTTDGVLFEGAQLQAVATSSGVWLAVGEDDDGGAAVYSAVDPEGTWTRITGWPFISLYGVATDGTTWAVAGEGVLDFSAGSGNPDSTSGGRVFTTTRPLEPHHWTQRATNATGFGSAPGFFGIHYAASRWVTWGNGGNLPVLFTATDATSTWTSQDTSAFDHPGILDITYGNSTWVALSGGSASAARQVLTASDPAGSWTNLGNVGPPGASFIRYAGGYWVAGGTRSSSGFHGGPWWATSPGGTWTEMTTAVGIGLALAHDGTSWLYVGTQGVSPFAARAVAASDPTGTWTQVTAPNSTGFTDFGNPLASDGRTWVIVGTDSSFSDSIIETAHGFSTTSFTADAVKV